MYFNITCESKQVCKGLKYLRSDIIVQNIFVCFKLLVRADRFVNIRVEDGHTPGDLEGELLFNGGTKHWVKAPH